MFAQSTARERVHGALCIRMEFGLASPAPRFEGRCKVNCVVVVDDSTARLGGCAVSAVPFAAISTATKLVVATGDGVGDVVRPSSLRDRLSIFSARRGLLQIVRKRRASFAGRHIFQITSDLLRVRAVLQFHRRPRKFEKSTTAKCEVRARRTGCYVARTRPLELVAGSLNRGGRPDKPVIRSQPISPAPRYLCGRSGRSGRSG